MDSSLAKILYRLNKEYKAIGNETLTISSTAVALTVPNNAVYALIYIESDISSGYAIRYWEDGSDPTTNEGIPRQADTAFDIEGRHNLLKCRLIQAQSGTHTAQIIYYI